MRSHAMLLLLLVLSLGYAQAIPVVANSGPNGGAGWTTASFFLTQVAWIDPAVVLANSQAPQLATSAAVLQYMAQSSLADPLFTVTNQSIYALAPSNDTRYYISHATYWWPGVNATYPGPNCNLSDPWHMHSCAVYNVDGVFSPDDYTFYAKANFINQATDTLALALAYVVFQNLTYIRYAAQMTDFWYVNATNQMHPDFSYVQTKTGPGKWVGGHSGILDMRWLMYVDSVLRILNTTIAITSPADGLGPIWTPTQQAVMQTWFQSASTFMSTATIALQEAAATNNHGTWQAAQNAAYAYYGGNLTGAAAIITAYLTKLYPAQFAYDGSQPLEINPRSRPMHYTLFNLEPLIYLAKLGEQVGVNVWTWPSAAGNNTIQQALSFYLVNITYAYDGENDTFSDAILHLYEVRAHYGDTFSYPPYLINASYTSFIQNYTAMQVNPPLVPLYIEGASAYLTANASSNSSSSSSSAAPAPSSVSSASSVAASNTSASSVPASNSSASSVSGLPSSSSSVAAVTSSTGGSVAPVLPPAATLTFLIALNASFPLNTTTLQALQQQLTAAIANSLAAGNTTLAGLLQQYIVVYEVGNYTFASTGHRRLLAVNSEAVSFEILPAVQTVVPSATPLSLAQSVASSVNSGTFNVSSVAGGAASVPSGQAVSASTVTPSTSSTGGGNSAPSSYLVWSRFAVLSLLLALTSALLL
jgi:hypothetical protein